MSDKSNIGVLGTGAWGLALSVAIAKKNKVNLFFVSEEEFKMVKENRKSKFLPLINLPANISFRNNLEDLKYCKYIFLAMPAQKMRKNLNLISSFLTTNNFIVCNKGIENETNKLMSEVIHDTIPNSNIIILSGPNLAQEVAQDLPTAFVLSSVNNEILKELGNTISNKNFRPYFNNDIIGTQLGGAVKNVIAIACGVTVAKNLGENARSSLITRGLQEVISLGEKMGAQSQTFYGLSGIGDLNLTCNSNKSRNFRFGFNLAREENLKQVQDIGFLAEGYFSCKSVNSLAKEFDIEMPICNSVKELLSGSSINEIINRLLSRPLQFEDF